MGTYLKRWGLAFQRPDKRAVEQDPEAVRIRREETWPAIRARAKAENGEVLFADQVGIRSDQITGRTWGAKGRTPVVRRTGNRFSVNAYVRSEPRGGCTSWPSPGPSTRRWCAASSPGSPGTSTGRSTWSSAHRSKTVRDWPADHKDQVELHLLPSYSPELNPDELVNADLKHQPAPHPQGQEPERTRRRNPQVLPPPTTPTPHCPWLLRPTRPPQPPNRSPSALFRPGRCAC
ncbi:transposase [Streptomyces sp. MUM 203J]|uniref:transposase n=1 Tax=Streptomyces sp. MUM 203J TaxID=2791990 RepID=UPI0035ABB98C